MSKIAVHDIHRNIAILKFLADMVNLDLGRLNSDCVDVL